MRLLIVQFAGDYREAVYNFASGKDETYYAQKYSVNLVAKLTSWVEEVSILCCTTKQAYNEVLPNGVRAIGGGFPYRLPIPELIALIKAQRPTHLIVDVHSREIFNWAAQNQIKALALFSGSVPTQTISNKIRGFLLARSLNRRQVEWVASYGINSSLLLHRLGVKAEKIVPWDFIIETTPGSLSPKQAPSDRHWTLFYVGSMIEGKGVGDILAAVAELKARNIFVKAQLAGQDSGQYAARAKELQIEDRIELLGIVPNKSIEPMMREADLVLIPSRHNYTEGFPLTIHHGLKSRTPIIASDHPMFRNMLEHKASAMIFPAANPIAMADCIQQLQSDQELYAALSDASYATWQHLRLQTKCEEVINHWLKDSPSDRKWFEDHRLTADLYRRFLT